MQSATPLDHSGSKRDSSLSFFHTPHSVQRPPHNMAWFTILEYKPRRGTRTDDTSLKPLDNGMPSSPVPFITPSSLVTFQHDLKARISSSPLVKVSLKMRPLVKKRTSIPFPLPLKRHSTTIFSRPSSSSSDVSASPACTPASELADPLSMADVAVDLPSEPAHTMPSIGAKILDRFWPEDEDKETCSEESRHLSIPSCYPTALAPPPHHRRSPRSLGSAHEVPFSDQFTPRTSNEHGPTPLRFPF